MFWTIVVLAAIAAVGVIAYMRGSDSWQDRYRKHVSEGIVKLLQENPYDQTAVVVVVVDGLRWEEGIGAEGKYIPHIWNDLRPLGTLLTDYRTVSPTATTSVHTAMLTGRISTVPNDGHIRPVFPTFLEYYRDARADYVHSEIKSIIDFPSAIYSPNAKSTGEVNRLIEEALEFGPEKTALYLGKDLIYSLKQSSSGLYPEDDVFLIDSMRDVEVTEYFRAKIPDEKPNAVVVNLGDVDECGHEAEWHYYVDAIRWADRDVWEMWQALQSESRYRDKTYFIVTTDHGRHSPERGGYVHHGCFCEGCQHSFMLLIGPGIKQGYVSNEPHNELDVAPTIGRAVGFETPGCTGKPILEAFENPESLPDQRQTPRMALVAKDKANVDERDTSKILLDALADRPSDVYAPDSASSAMMLLAVAARVRNHPEESVRWSDWCTKIEGLDPSGDTISLKTLYPWMQLRREVEAASGNGSGDPTTPPWGTPINDFIQNLVSAGGGLDIETQDIETISLTAPGIALYGAYEDKPDATRYSFELLLKTLAKYEGEDRVYAPGLDNLISDFRYREGPNEIFTEKHLSMRERMWLVWSLERVLAESNPEHVPDLYPLVNRQYRLLVAFMHEWQDSDAVLGGTGDIGELVDFVSQGLALSILSEFKPWRKWELDELGYSMHIYATPLFSWPPRHFFYLLGQANALAGGWASNERMRLYVNDDGWITYSLKDRQFCWMMWGPDYVTAAAALAYGFERFELADYDLYDLEMYPIVHQQ